MAHQGSERFLAALSSRDEKDDRKHLFVIKAIDPGGIHLPRVACSKSWREIRHNRQQTPSASKTWSSCRANPSLCGRKPALGFCSCSQARTTQPGMVLVGFVGNGKVCREGHSVLFVCFNEWPDFFSGDIFTRGLSRAFNRWVPRQRQLQIDCSRNGK